MEELKLHVYVKKPLTYNTKHCFDRIDQPQFFDRKKIKHLFERVNNGHVLGSMKLLINYYFSLFFFVHIFSVSFAKKP